ncbi:MAG: tetratricopeptide repeat protein [Bacteroidetes bacterium]|nr:tetratricopeptide repeat protein [Bacteroidota bacterium]
MSKFRPVILLLVVATIFSCSNFNQNSHSSYSADADSLTILSIMITEDSLNAELFASRARLYLEKGNLDPALRDIQSALKITPQNPELFILLSDVYFVLGQTDNAIASLKKSIRLSPDNVVPLLKLSEIYLLLEDPNTSLRYADEAIAKDRRNAESYYVKAMILMEKRDTNQAITNFRISSNLDTSNYMTYMQLGAIYNSRDDTVSKLYFERALKTKQDDERAMYYLGMYFQEHNQYTRAINMFSKLIELYPDNKRAYYNMGYIYLVEFEDFENAQAMFEKSVALSPGFVEAVYNLGRTKEAKGDYEGAYEQYRKSLEILPNYPLAVQSLNRLDDMLIRHKK